MDDIAGVGDQRCYSGIDRWLCLEPGRELLPRLLLGIELRDTLPLHTLDLAGLAVQVDESLSSGVLDLLFVACFPNRISVFKDHGHQRSTRLCANGIVDVTLSSGLHPSLFI